MKQTSVRSRRSLLRRASRAQRRRSAGVRVNVRRPSATPAPWDESADTCQYYLAAESYSAKPVPGAVDPLEALHPPFRQSAGWTKQTKAEPTRGINFVMGMRRPARESVVGSGCRFVAIDPDNYRGNAMSDPAAHQEFWDHQMNGRPFSMPFLKSGPAIWKKLGINVPLESTTYMMQMESVDAETSDAIQAAIWSAYNTAAYPIDIETVVFALATFIHADPLRKHLVSEEAFDEPYGDRTQYVLKPVYNLAAGGRRRRR